MPKVSVVIVAYNMVREIPRTVLSFLPPYQQNIAPDDVEILVLENGSPDPIPASVREQWPSMVRYIKVPSPHPSPASALNLGVRLARADIIVPVIDGARMASPGLLKFGLSALQQNADAFVATIGFHLGKKRQSVSVHEGYNQDVEDKLLQTINWPSNGYKLFGICAAGGSAGGAWFGTVSESNAPLLSKARYSELGGFDTAFDFAGGGLVNLDFFERAVNAPYPYYMLIGEGTFHQFHGGVTTSRSVREIEEDGRTTFQRYSDQYEKIRNQPWQYPTRRPILFGVHRPECVAISKQTLATISDDQ